MHALKQLLILHADHEQNCSTSTVRLVGSSDANIYASIAAGVDALWGPLHGGANQAAIEMLESIRDNGGDVQPAVDRAKDPNDDFRLSGFGHRVYKNYDPRAADPARAPPSGCSPISASTDSLFDIALDSSRSRSPTTTSSSASCTRTSTSTPVSSTGRWVSRPTCSPCCSRIGRLPGWLAHWKEAHENPKTKIGRPRQIYTGPTERKYVAAGATNLKPRRRVGALTARGTSYGLRRVGGAVRRVDGRRGPRPDVAWSPVADVERHLPRRDASRMERWLLFGLWLWVGWHFFIRGWTFFLRGAGPREPRHSLGGGSHSPRS